MMFLRTLPVAVFIAAPLYLSAGDWDAPWFLAYAAMAWLSTALIYTLAPPELFAERMKPPSDRDPHSRRIALPLVLAHYALAGLDARFGWSTLSVAVQAAGFACVAASLGLVGWTLLTNPFASSAVRIQTERDQRVISSGPYALVRHPMYLGVLLSMLGSPPALGSWWSVLPLLPILPVFVRRTLLEDRMLHNELRGYAEYAHRVRWRVVPRVF